MVEKQGGKSNPKLSVKRSRNKRGRDSTDTQSDIMLFIPNQFIKRNCKTTRKSHVRQLGDARSCVGERIELNRAAHSETVALRQLEVLRTLRCFN